MASVFGMSRICMVVLVYCSCLLTNCLVAAEDSCAQSNPGTLSSCFDPVVGKVDFEVNWTPANISKNQSYTVTVKKLGNDFVLPMFDPPFVKGYVNFTVLIPNLDDRPLYHTLEPVTCLSLADRAAEQFNVSAALIESFCPFKGGLPLPKTIFEIGPQKDMPIPMGSYHVRLELLQEEETQNSTLFCADGWLIFANVTPSWNCHQPEVPTGMAANDVMPSLTNKEPIDTVNIEL